MYLWLLPALPSALYLVFYFIGCYATSYLGLSYLSLLKTIVVTISLIELVITVSAVEVTTTTEAVDAAWW